MKKVVIALGLMAMTFLSVASAADANLVSNIPGTEVSGLGEAMGVAPAPYSTTNTQVLYSGSTGWQNVADDASGTKYQKIKAQLIALGGIEVGNTGIVYLVTKAVRVGCTNNSSYIQLPDTANSQPITNDGCAYRDKVRANAF